MSIQELYSTEIDRTYEELYRRVFFSIRLHGVVEFIRFETLKWDLIKHGIEKHRNNVDTYLCYVHLYARYLQYLFDVFSKLVDLFAARFQECTENTTAKLIHKDCYLFRDRISREYFMLYEVLLNSMLDVGEERVYLC